MGEMQGNKVMEVLSMKGVMNGRRSVLGIQADLDSAV